MFEKYPSEIVMDFKDKNCSFYDWQAGKMRTEEVWHLMTGLLRSTESHLRAKFFGTIRYDTNTKILISIQHAVIASIPVKDQSAKKKAMAALPPEKNESLEAEKKSGKVMITLAEKYKKFAHVRVATQ
jgi:hypothetical protein